MFFVSSTFFAAGVTAIRSLSGLHRIELERKKSRDARRLLKLLNDIHLFVASLRFGYLLSLFGLVCSATLLAEAVAGVFVTPFPIVLFLTLVVLSAALFTFHEIIVKNFIKRRAQSFAELTSFLMLWQYRLFRPFVRVLERTFSAGAPPPAGENSDNHNLAPVDDEERLDALEDAERAMIHSIFEFGDTEVHEIMVPRTDMVCVEENTDFETLVKLIDERGHSRIPLYSEGVDNILGVIHVKDLLPYMTSEKVSRPALKELARPAYFVPETKKLGTLLKEFQRDKHHMAIVVDEYGGTAGLITLEDIIEEIVGDIQDEYDKEPPLYRKLDDQNYIIDAKIDLHELNEKLNFDLPTEGEYESLGGFILSLTGYVPDEKEVVTYGNYTFFIEKVDRNRIRRVKLTRTLKEDSEKVESNP